jgi:hypothetical protein
MVTSVRETGERHGVGALRGGGLRQWALVLAPLAIAFEQQQLSYELLDWACRRSSAASVHTTSTVALLLVLAIGLVASLRLGHVGWRPPDDERTSDARDRFMSALALLMVGFSTLLIVAQWMPAFFIDPCQR